MLVVGRRPVCLQEGDGETQGELAESLQGVARALQTRVQVGEDKRVGRARQGCG